MESQLFQCKPSSNQVYTPIIDDSYFRSERLNGFLSAGMSTLTTAIMPDVTYIFTIPPEQEHRNCSGTVRTIQYCYKATPRTNDSEVMLGVSQEVFTYFLMARNGYQFTVTRSFAVASIPQNINCKIISDAAFCCDNHTTDMEISSSQYTFGIRQANANIQPLAFAESVMEFRARHFQTSVNENNFTLGSADLVNDSSLFLLRFFIVGKIQWLCV